MQHQALRWHDTPLALADELLQPVADAAQARDLSLNLLHLLLRLVAHRFSGVCAVFDQGQQLADLSERIPVRLHLLDEPQQRDHVSAIVPIASGQSRR